MTRKEILAMKPGRELDKLVAEKVMGWNIATAMETVEGQLAVLLNGVNIFDSNPSDWSIVPSYSTDISAAWEVVEKTREIGFNFEMTWWSHNDFGIENRLRAWVYKRGVNERCICSDTAPEAICKAALLAVMEEA